MKRRKVVVAPSIRKRKSSNDFGMMVVGKNKTTEFLIHNKPKKPIWRMCKRNAGTIYVSMYICNMHPDDCGDALGGVCGAITKYSWGSFGC